MSPQLAEYYIDILEFLDQLRDVEEFYMRVCNLRDLILENDSTYKESYFVACFIQGLRQDIGEFVLQCGPTTLNSAYAFALQRESKNEKEENGCAADNMTILENLIVAISPTLSEELEEFAGDTAVEDCIPITKSPKENSGLEEFSAEVSLEIAAMEGVIKKVTLSVDNVSKEEHDNFVLADALDTLPLSELAIVAGHPYVRNFVESLLLGSSGWPPPMGSIFFYFSGEANRLVEPSPEHFSFFHTGVYRRLVFKKTPIYCFDLGIFCARIFTEGSLFVFVFYVSTHPSLLRDLMLCLGVLILSWANNSYGYCGLRNDTCKSATEAYCSFTVYLHCNAIPLPVCIYLQGSCSRVQGGTSFIYIFVDQCFNVHGKEFHIGSISYCLLKLNKHLVSVPTGAMFELLWLNFQFSNASNPETSAACDIVVVHSRWCDKPCSSCELGSCIHRFSYQLYCFGMDISTSSTTYYFLGHKSRMETNYYIELDGRMEYNLFRMWSYFVLQFSESAKFGNQATLAAKSHTKRYHFDGRLVSFKSSWSLGQQFAIGLGITLSPILNDEILIISKDSISVTAMLYFGLAIFRRCLCMEMVLHCCFIFHWHPGIIIVAFLLESYQESLHSILQFRHNYCEMSCSYRDKTSIAILPSTPDAVCYTATKENLFAGFVAILFAKKIFSSCIEIVLAFLLTQTSKAALQFLLPYCYDSLIRCGVVRRKTLSVAEMGRSEVLAWLTHRALDKSLDGLCNSSSLLTDVLVQLKSSRKRVSHDVESYTSTVPDSVNLSVFMCSSMGSKTSKVFMSRVVVKFSLTCDSFMASLECIELVPVILVMLAARAVMLSPTAAMRHHVHIQTSEVELVMQATAYLHQEFFLKGLVLADAHKIVRDKTQVYFKKEDSELQECCLCFDPGIASPWPWGACKALLG